MPNILLDTGVWLCFCDSRDQLAPREEVDALFELTRPHTIVLPWPIAYETLRTRFARNQIAVLNFEREVRSERVILIDDAIYRDNALQLCLQSSRRGRPLSMVDCTIRLILDDVNVKINYFATYNANDFYDVCARKRIVMLPE